MNTPKPTAEGIRRYPPDGYYVVPAPESIDLLSVRDPCTCDEHCADPCMGATSCECLACSLRSVVERGSDPIQLTP